MVNIVKTIPRLHWHPYHLHIKSDLMLEFFRWWTWSIYYESYVRLFIDLKRLLLFILKYLQVWAFIHEQGWKHCKGVLMPSVIRIYCIIYALPYTVGSSNLCERNTVFVRWSVLTKIYKKCGSQQRHIKCKDKNWTVRSDFTARWKLKNFQYAIVSKKF